MKNIRLLAILLLVHLFLFINLRFTAWPEMLSFPYLLNNGFSLYQDMVHPYPPLLTIILSRVFLWFGYSVSVLKIVTWGFILINDIFIWLIVQKLTQSRAAAFMSVLFYVLVQPFLKGNMMWVDLGFVPFVLAGIYAFIRGLEKPHNPTSYALMISGLLFVLGAFIKQTAVLFLVVALIYLLIHRYYKASKYLLIAPLFMSSLFVLKLYSIGDLQHFLNWTVLYPSQVWTGFPGYVDMALTRREFAIVGILFIPLMAYMLFRFKEQKNNLVLWIMLLVSCIVVYPRFSFFHLQSGIALGSILMGATYGLRKQYAVFVGVMVLLFPLVHKPVLATEWRKPDRFNSRKDHELTEEIRKRIPRDMTVFLINVHSGYYVYADRLPAKPWVDNFGWYYEIPEVQESVLSKWQESPPDYILWKEVEVGEWYELGTYEPRVVTQWIMSNYQKQDEVQKGVWIWEKEN